MISQIIKLDREEIGSGEIVVLPRFFFFQSSRAVFGKCKESIEVLETGLQKDYKEMQLNIPISSQ